MLRLAAGHAASLDELMERHGGRLFHYLIRLIQDESEAADLAQETFARVYQNRSRYDPAHKFSTWLYTIATNLVRDRQRWRARRPELSLDIEDPGTGQRLGASLPEPRADPGQTLVAAERTAAVQDAVARLPEDLRVPLVLALYEGQSHQEIGAVLGCTAKAVEMKIYRARKELRQSLAALLEE
jgi:RNA polymerase sigma-70 factor (ECF subfamily)